MSNGEKEYYSVGRVKDAHGLRGEIYIKLRSKQADWLGGLKELLLSDKEKPVELKKYNLKFAKPHREGLRISVEGVGSRTEAELLRGKFMLIPSELLVTSDEDDFYLYEVQDFEVHDEKLGVLGKITGFGSNGAQDLIVVEGRFGKVEIPLIDPFIVKILFAEKKVLMDLPEGLVSEDDI